LVASFICFSVGIVLFGGVALNPERFPIRRTYRVLPSPQFKDIFREICLVYYSKMFYVI